MDSNAFLNDLMSKMKLPEAKGKKKAEQSESVAQILAAMQKVRAEKKKPPVTSYAPVKEMPVNEPESMEEFSQLASDVMQECRPSMPTVKTSISEKTVRVAAYIRVSSTNPAQEDSYEMQERYFMSLLAGNAGWTSAGIYSDHGISATSREGRTGFNRLLRHCKQGKIDRVICKSISRFARNTQDFLVALRTLKENNVTILFEREAMDTADAYSEFILTTLAAIAQEESRSISANIAWSNQKRFPAGNVCNKDIYGYEFRKGEYTVNENGYRYRAVFIIPEEAEIVRMVFRLFTKEELGFTQIAQKLDALHIQPPNSGCRQRQKRKPTVLPVGALKEEDKRGWTATDVRYMIANIRYCGSVLCQKTYTDHRNGHKQKVNKGEKPKYLIRNHHPAIISEELWQEAQEVWKAYTAKYRGIEKGRNERNYSKLLLCGECGRYFQGHSTTRTTIWRCATKLAQQGQKRCRMEAIYEEQIQALLRKAFAEKFYKPKADGTQGPIVKKVKTYKKMSLGVEINKDEAGVGRGIAENANGGMIRVDVFRENGKYYFVPIYIADALKKRLPNKAAMQNKPYSEWKEMKDENFLFSLYSRDLIGFKNPKGKKVKCKDGKEIVLTKEIVYYVGANINTASISCKAHDNQYEFGSFGIQSLQELKKYQVDVLGNITEVRQEKRRGFH